MYMITEDKQSKIVNGSVLKLKWSFASVNIQLVNFYLNNFTVLIRCIKLSVIKISYMNLFEFVYLT